MANEPIRERILQDIAAALGLVAGQGAYHHQLVSVVRAAAPAPAALDVLPGAWITEGEETLAPGPLPRLTRHLAVTVEALLGATDSKDAGLATLVNYLLADIERALTADPQRGGLAVDTAPVSNAVTLDPEPGVLAAVTVTFLVHYRTRYGAPDLVS